MPCHAPLHSRLQNHIVALPRELLSDYRFSNGALVEKGTFVGASMLTAHFDPAKYPSPELFKPWRFFTNTNSEAAVKNRFTTPSAEFLPFGAGKHAWYVLYTVVVLIADADLKLKPGTLFCELPHEGTLRRCHHELRRQIGARGCQTTESSYRQ